MDLVKAPVLKQTKVAEDQFVLRLSCPTIAQKAEPGQFVTLKLNTSFDPLLRRPFSIHSVDREAGELLIYYQVVGKTTELMSELKEDDEVSLLGPLGKGFNVELENSRVLLIGGGLGQAPLRFLAEELKKKNNQITIVLGARDTQGLKNIVCFNEYCQEIKLTTEDGSIGTMGYVTEHIPDLIKVFKPQRLYACGPLPMLRVVKVLAQQAGIPCQVSLESKMACGIGVCLGCTCESSDGSSYPKVCTHGPVFWAEEVKLDG